MLRIETIATGGPGRMALALLSSALVVAGSARAEMSAEELAKLAQNPVGNLISVPFQDNLNLNSGPLARNQNVLNIQPVIPIDFSPDWNIITRTIIPVISQPALDPSGSRINGIGPVQISAFLSPANPTNGTIWGIGAITQLPTATNSILGSNQWGLGPTFVILKLEKGNPWVYGVLVNDVWSVGYGPGGSYNNLLMQPFVNYNFKGGAYLTSAPDHYREPQRKQWQCVDDPCRRRHRQNFPLRQAAREHAARRLLQCGAPRIRRELDDTGSDTVHVPQVRP